MQVAQLPAEERKAKGTNAIRNLRNTGKIPMVLYGGEGEPVSLQADYDAVKRHLSHQLRVYKLDIGGKEVPGFLKAVQWDCLTDEPLHVDFTRIKMDEPLKIEIRLTTLGHPRGVVKGGRLIQDVKTLSLACMPDSVPELIEVKIEWMECGDKILAKDLPLPDGVSLDMPEDRCILRVTDPDA